MARAATTAIDMAMRISYRFFAFAKVNSWTFAIVVTAVLGFSTPVHPADYTVGIVTQGAFLLAENPNIKRGGRDVHGLVGYLPIGTRVYFNKDRSRAITNLTKAKIETYYPVYSSIGINGLLREDLFIQVKDKPIAVVVSETTLHNPDPAKDPDPDNGIYKELLRIGRYDNAYLEIMGRSPTHFHAVLNRRGDTATNLPKEEPVRLWKTLVDEGLVIMVESNQSFDEQSIPAPKWKNAQELDESWIIELARKIKDKLGYRLDNVEAILGNANSIDNIQCLIKASADAELGFNVFSNGLSFQLDMTVKEYSQTIQLMRRKLQLDGGNQTTDYLLLRNVKCDGGTPERLQRLTLQEGVNPKDRASVRFKDLATEQSKWVVSLQGSKVPSRMIRIENEQGYMRALTRLDDLTDAGDSYISRLSPEMRDILLNFILREISHFEHPNRLVPSSND